MSRNNLIQTFTTKLSELESSNPTKAAIPRGATPYIDAIKEQELRWAIIALNAEVIVLDGILRIEFSRPLYQSEVGVLAAIAREPASTPLGPMTILRLFADAIPEDPELSHQLGCLMYEYGRYEYAQNWLEKSVVAEDLRGPRSHESTSDCERAEFRPHYLGYSALLQGRGDVARAWFQAAKAAWRTPGPWLGLAACEAADCNWSNAAKYMEVVLARWPEGEGEGDEMPTSSDQMWWTINLARIFAVADDSLKAALCYKRAYTYQKNAAVLRELVPEAKEFEQRGTVIFPAETRLEVKWSGPGMPVELVPRT